MFSEAIFSVAPVLFLFFYLDWVVGGICCCEPWAILGLGCAGFALVDIPGVGWLIVFTVCDKGCAGFA